MFTGLVEEVGTVSKLSRAGETLVLTVRAKRVAEGMRRGDSVAVNGACLTVVRFDANSVSMEVMPETFRRTALQRLAAGDRVNLERALAATGRFGGHIVQGHVDGVGVIRRKETDGNAVRIAVELQDEELFRHVLPKGSIAVDGVSLTITDVSAPTFRVSVIPHTLAETVLQNKAVGAEVNVETDVIGKYVEHLLSRPGASREATRGQERGQGAEWTERWLQERGFA